MDDLEDRPDLLEILSKESIQSGKSDEIATQIAQAGEAILHLQENKEQVAKGLNNVLLGEIGRSVPLDTEAQATEFVDDLISALEEQRRAIGTTPTPEKEEASSPPQDEDVQELSGEYVIKIQNDGETRAAFADDNQSDVMADTVSYLIENHNLISEVESLPYVPGRKNAILNDTPTHPDDKGEMRTYREVAGEYYLFTSFNKRDKKRHVQRFADKCGLEVDFEGGW